MWTLNSHTPLLTELIRQRPTGSPTVTVVGTHAAFDADLSGSYTFRWAPTRWMAIMLSIYQWINFSHFSNGIHASASSYGCSTSPNCYRVYLKEYSHVSERTRYVRMRGLLDFWHPAWTFRCHHWPKAGFFGSSSGWMRVVDASTGYAGYSY